MSFFKNLKKSSNSSKRFVKSVVLEQLLLFDEPEEYELLYKKGRLSYVRIQKEGTQNVVS